jgi:hypothetical protein
LLLAICNDPARRERMMAMLRAATTSSEADLRMSLFAAHPVGLEITRYIVLVEPLASLPPEPVADVAGPTLQRYMIGKLS